MRVTNYYGNVQTCVVCKSEEIEKYFVYTPAFADAINSVFICGCKDHIEEARKKKDNADSNRINSAIMSSGS
jgi:hypothetical protein